MVSAARKQAARNNSDSELAADALKQFVCPHDRSSLTHKTDFLECEHSHRFPIHNGVPDFLANTTLTTDKQNQAAFHDDEDVNERFEEIVLRPFQVTKSYVDSSLFLLRTFKKILPAKLGIGLKDVSILNCGCGGGMEAQFLAEEGARVTGFDISQLRAEASATRFALHKLPGMFYRGEASVLPFRDNSFDLVLFHDSLHHVPIEEIPLAVREAARVAKKGVILLEAHDSPFRMLLETLGFSTSIEASGNYVFRFRSSLIEFFAAQTSTELVNYSITFMRHEHQPQLYSRPLLGRLTFAAQRLLSPFLRPIGNEACIILKKKSSSDPQTI